MAEGFRSDDRFARPRALFGDKLFARLQRSLVVLVGAGLLGGAVLRELCQLNVPVINIDPGLVDPENLGNQLFQARDVGSAKVDARAAFARECTPDCRVVPVQSRVQDVPLGLFHPAKLIVAGLDNRSARVAVAEIAQKLGVPQIDMAVDGTGRHRIGTISHYDARRSQSACYACKLGPGDLASIRTEGRAQGCASWRDPESPETPPTVAAGSFGVTVAGIATTWAIDVLLGAEGGRTNRQTQVFEDGETRVRTLTLERNERCPLPHRALKPLKVVPAGTIGELATQAGKDLGEEPERIQLHGRNTFVRDLHCYEHGETRSWPRLAHAYTDEDVACGCKPGAEFQPLELLDHLERHDFQRLYAMEWEELGLATADVVTAVASDGREASYVVGRHPAWQARNRRGSAAILGGRA